MSTLTLHPRFAAALDGEATPAKALAAADVVTLDLLERDVTLQLLTTSGGRALDEALTDVEELIDAACEAGLADRVVSLMDVLAGLCFTAGLPFSLADTINERMAITTDGSEFLRQITVMATLGIEPEWSDELSDTLAALLETRDAR